MAFFIAAMVVAFFALVLFIIGTALKKQNAGFQQNKRHGLAEVVGYKRSSQSNYLSLLVRIPALNDGQTYICTSGKINTSDYPKGSVVKVWYAPKRVAGIHVVEVYLYDNPPADSTKIAQGIIRLSVVMFAIVGMLTAAGLSTLL